MSGFLNSLKIKEVMSKTGVEDDIINVSETQRYGESCRFMLVTVIVIIMCGIIPISSISVMSLRASNL